MIYCVCGLCLQIWPQSSLNMVKVWIHILERSTWAGFPAFRSQDMMMAIYCLINSNHGHSLIFSKYINILLWLKRQEEGKACRNIYNESGWSCTQTFCMEDQNIIPRPSDFYFCQCKWKMWLESIHRFVQFIINGDFSEETARQITNKEWEQQLVGTTVKNSTFTLNRKQDAREELDCFTVARFRNKWKGDAVQPLADTPRKRQLHHHVCKLTG
jgi:hypothetical protein